MFSKSLELTLNSAFARAREKRHEFITVEHLLLSLLDNPEACGVLVACGGNLDRLRVGLGIFIDETTPHVPMNVERDIQPTLSFQRVLQRAIYQVQTTGRQEVSGTNVLTAIFGEQESQAVYFLSQENVTRMDVVNYITQGVTKDHDQAPGGGAGSQNQSSSIDHSDIQPNIEPTPQIETPMKEATADESAIELYAVNLNERAGLGKIDPLIGREEEVMRSIQILCRRSKNNPLFVGEAGVGKTAIAEGLAQMIIKNKVPKALAGCTVYSLDLGVMLAGTKYRGDFEKRFKTVLKALGKQTGAIVFIDEIHNLVGAGSATGGTMDASNLIKPMLSGGELRCMGATTYEEYRNFFAKDNALMRRFQKIDVVEPSNEETIKIIKGLQSRFESYHGVSYTDDAIDQAVELSSRYMADRHLPDKAIDVIDEAGAYQQIQPSHKTKKVIGTHEIEAVIAKMARIPAQQIGASDKQILKRLPARLKKVVYGQDHAIDALTSAIKLSRSGLREIHKPIGSFLLSGPTGVGKTEVTRQLAKEMGVELLRFDMSEYMEKHTASRLIGAPPGYVGFDQGGLLTEAVMKNPHCILLLDEIEKAHPDLFNILLQVMDYGQLTDNNGRKADFKHVVIVMTTNAGAQDLEKNTIGFAGQESEEDNLGALKQYFTPEFRNRLDAVVQFKHLDTVVINKVIEKCLKTLKGQLITHDVKFSISAQAKAWLSENGYDRKMGARPMEKLIQDRIKQPLADELLFGKLVGKDGVVRVGVENGELSIKIAAASEKEKA
jgi:ATP-dependent Clp protease ATP-binding subunit ClpA